MTRTATVNYHVHKPHRQAFELDAGGMAGHLVSPELVSKAVAVEDVRATAVPVTIASDAVEFTTLKTQVRDFAGNAWKPTYNAELTATLSDRLGAREVVVFDHTVRIDDQGAERKPARNVHSDYSKDGAEQRLVDLLGAEVAAEWAQGHYGFVNVWRPVEQPINSAPLGFVRPSSVDPSDWILLDLIYPNRKGQIMGLVGNPEHEWIYQSKMTPDEVAIFNIYDNQGVPSIAHSALDLVEDPGVTTIRKSIESRTLVRYYRGP
ncbi:CmcJ/NvfI family oxidoreductase [Ruegeria arenilitoris]|uniref:CmcJ/NvfI family oxidoreductase n=1 Tax=Ruegeria arenilitoris TaxID=1173585 RepID=UPI0014818869|nr:CmcJ/NvfI family oxidoreductase [Ruegeria arenilitoris]